MVKEQTIEWFTPEEKPFGISFGQWTVRWWQWALSIPKNINPVTDKSGIYANTNQDERVWFLAGTWGEGEKVKRYCSLPHNKAILIPIINYETNRMEKPNLISYSEMVKDATEDQNDIRVKDFKINNDESVPIRHAESIHNAIFRVKSDPSIFPLYIHPDNYFKLKGGKTDATADGYWVFLKSLPKGKHQLYFHGACSAGTRQTTAEYNIEII